MKYLAVILLSLVIASASAQASWSIPAKSGEMQFADIVYLETVYRQQNHTVNDTLSGTGFLLTMDSAVYLVTTKHQLQAKIEGKEQKQITNNLLISGSYNKKMNMMCFNWLPANKKSYIFSSDKEDIAIISFKSKRNKPALRHLLMLNCKAVPVDSLSFDDNFTAGDSLFMPEYHSLYSNFIRIVQQGLGPVRIKYTSQKSPSITLKDPMYVSYSGAPLFKDDKIVGMLIHPGGASTTAAILKNPYAKAKTGVGIKARYILRLLRKLQKQEEGR